MGFYPFRGPDAPFARNQFYHILRRFAKELRAKRDRGTFRQRGAVRAFAAVATVSRMELITK